MKLDKILVALDFGAASLAAAQWAVEHLGPDADFVLFHALAVPAPPSFLRGTVPDADTRLALLRSDAETRLQELAASLPTERVAVELAVGRPADEIARAAERLGADLILLGAHGHRANAWDAIGSSAEQVVRCSSVPALVARGLPAAGFRRVLVSVDDSGLTDAVLAWASFLTRRLSAQLVILHVLDAGLWGAARQADSPEAMSELERAAEASTRQWLAQRIGAAGLEAPRVDVLVAFGDPKYEIVSAADAHGADLLVMGSRGSDEVSPAHLGGVAAAVLRGSTRPVLIVTGAGA